ncbi:MAG: HAD family hydrolase [Pirellula sp.]
MSFSPKSTQPFDAAIFDLDGTLLDSLEDIADAANQVLSELGKPTHPIADYRYHVGDGVGMLFQRALPECKLDPDLRQHCMQRFETAYATCWNNRSNPYDGINELLYSLSRSSMTLAVLSNKPDSFTKMCVEHFFPDVTFAYVIGHSDRFPRKPDPTSAAWIAEQFRVASDRIAYVGDTSTDMKTALGARLFAIGVAWGFRPESELSASGAQIVCKDVDALASTLLGSRA